jgi:hypothetical protein
MIRGMMRLTPWLALALASPAAAQDQPRPQWEGVWQGTIGTLPVRACFFKHSDDWSVGSYYYLSRMRAIALDRERDGTWIEHGAGGGDVTGRWAIVRDGDRLVGDWRQGNRRLEIALRPVPAELADGGACGSDEYIAPRVRPLTVRTSAKSLGGFAYTEVIHDAGPHLAEVAISTFSYAPTRPGDRAINAALRIDPQRFEGDADYLACLKQALASTGYDGDFSFNIGPARAERNFLSVLVAGSGSCGGAHPYHYSLHRTYDRQSGRLTDLSRWFVPAAVVPRLPDDAPDLHKLAPALRGVVMGYAGGLERDCREVIESADYWDIALAPAGLDFTPSLPHAATACAEAIRVPYAGFARHLSAEGRAAWGRVGPAS